MLCILKGSAPFYSLLCDQLSMLGHPFMIDFYRVKSYEGTGSSGQIKVFGGLPKSIEGRHVIIVEDIVDTGSTLKDVLPKVAELKPKSFKVCSMLVKRLEKNNDSVTDVVELDDGLIGFSIPNAFVVGYGLDYNEMYRDLRDIWILGEEGIQGGGFGL
jgi:hypoxanthine phosphoribosyltransferase